VALYVLFFIWWEPGEAFIYSAPLQLTLWLLLHSSWRDEGASLRWRVAIAAAAAVVIPLSLIFLWHLRSPAPKFLG